MFKYVILIISLLIICLNTSCLQILFPFKPPKEYEFKLYQSKSVNKDTISMKVNGIYICEYVDHTYNLDAIRFYSDYTCTFIKFGGSSPGHNISFIKSSVNEHKNEKSKDSKGYYKKNIKYGYDMEILEGSPGTGFYFHYYHVKVTDSGIFVKKTHLRRYKRAMREFGYDTDKRIYRFFKFLPEDK